jgi:Fe2+ or Zn2+ uptake regulation protein
MVNPSINALSQLKFGGVKMGKETAQNYLEAMLDEGMVKRYQLSNGTTSYQLKTS